MFIALDGFVLTQIINPATAQPVIKIISILEG